MSGEHPCWLYRMTTGCHGWFHCLYLSISTSFEDESDDGSDSDNVNEDEDASSPSDDEMSA